jgi:hypothetical protein
MHLKWPMITWLPPARLLLAVALFGLLMSPQAQALTINPTFDSSIANDTNSAAIENVINGVINTYQHDFSDPITLNIEYQEIGTGISGSITSNETISYSNFITALHNDGKTTNDVTALAQLPIVTTNPVSGTTNIIVSSANEKAVGLVPSAFTFDGIVQLNTHVTDVGSPGTTGAFSLAAATEHEMDEVLGLQSSVAFSAPSSNPFVYDLFRYDASANRSFTKLNTAKAFFSINGTTDLDQFENTGNGHDYGDWLTNTSSPQVQDAVGTAASHPTLGVELTALDVIGYDFITSVPEPASIALFGPGLAALGLLRRRRLTPT